MTDTLLRSIAEMLLAMHLERRVITDYATASDEDFQRRVREQCDKAADRLADILAEGVDS